MQAGGAIANYGVHAVVANILHTRKDRVLVVTQQQHKPAGAAATGDDGAASATHNGTSAVLAAADAAAALSEAATAACAAAAAAAAGGGGDGDGAAAPGVRLPCDSTVAGGLDVLEILRPSSAPYIEPALVSAVAALHDQYVRTGARALG